jgi:protein involved in polysaccharide export with SLBB domain
MRRAALALLAALSLFMIPIAHAQSYTPEQAQAKLGELGISEEEAKRRAKELGINLEEAAKAGAPNPGAANTGTKIQVSQANAPPVEVTIPATSTIPADLVPPAASRSTVPAGSIPSDTAAAPSGPLGLDYFGYDIFKHIPAAFEPNAVGPVDPGYQLGPGDVMRLSVWGEAEFQYELQVDREGRVLIPKAGQVFVLGTPLNTLVEKLRNQLSRFYSGLSSDPPTTFLDVSITKLRPLRIFVMGEVMQPGGYTISSYATVFNALYSVGGPLVRGSLRNVKVLRDNKIVAVVDLYDYLLRGDQTSDVRLQNNDVVFIPPRGRTVSIRGEIRRPAAYELKETEHLLTLINYAGGLLSTAYLDHAQIDRVKPFAERTKGTDDRIVVDVNLNDVSGTGGKDVVLTDTDEVQVFSILDEKRNFVSIAGSVWRPGRYELGTIRTLKDLLAAARGLKPETYLAKGDLERVRADQTREYLTFDVEKVLQGGEENDIALRPKDSVRLYSIHEIAFDRTVSITGHVKFPGTVPYADSLTLYDLVFRAGGLLDPEFRKQAYLERADLLRLNGDMITKRIIPFDLQRLLTDSTYNVPVLPRDEVIIYGIGVKEVLDKYVTIEGEVKSPGTYPLRSNMTVNDLILVAGGLAEDARGLEIEVSRVRPQGLLGDTLAILLHPKLTDDYAATASERSLQEVSSTDPSVTEELYLQHRDQVVVRPNPFYKVQQNVMVEGEVMFPGIYTLKRRGERISEALARAGGPTSTAYLGGGQFWRGEQRVIVDFKRAYQKRDKNHDLVLFPGDRLVVPPRPRTVAVAGEVNNPGLQAFREGFHVSDYIERAGARTDSSNYALLLVPTGETRKVRFGYFSSDPEVMEGSRIVVTKRPPEPLRERKPIDLGATIKDSFGIVSSAATVIYLISQITK